MKKRSLMLLVFIISIICGWGQSPSDGIYTITAVHSGHALAVENGSTSDGANIIQATSTGATSQQWEVTNLDGTYYSIINVNSGLSLDVFEFSTADGGNIVQWQYLGNDNQQWLIESTGDGDGSFYIESRLSAKVLDVEGISTSSGANILQWEYWGNDNQQWIFTPADDNSDGGDDGTGDLGDNLSVTGPSPGADGSSKASGTSYNNVRDGDVNSYWQPTGSSNERISVKWGSDVTCDAIVIKELGDVVTSWEVTNHDNGNVLATGSTLGAEQLIQFNAVTLSKINLNIISASSAPQIGEFEVYNTGGSSGGGGTTQYTVSTNTNGSGSISLSPSGGTYEEGTSVTVTANPASGWEFDSWSGDLSGSNNQETIFMDSDKSVTANFSETDDGGGGSSSITLQENETGFCGVDGAVESEHSGYTGDGFSNTENSNGTGIDYQVNVGSSGTYTFEIRYASGSGDRPGQILQNGSVVQSNVSMPGTGAWDSWATVTTTANLSAGVSDLRLEATSGSGLPNIDYIAISGTSISAADCGSGGGGGTTEYNLTVSVSPSGSGSVSPNGGTYEEGTTVTLNATAASGYEFSGWSGDASGTSSSTTITMDSDKNVTAIFSSTGGGSGDANFAQVGYSTLAGGTTGGQGGTSVTCATGTCIEQAISDKLDGIISGPLTIYVDGTITQSNTDNNKIDIKDVNDISVLGVGTNGVFDGVGIKIWRASNVIIRNVTIHHVSEGDGDCIGIEGPSDHIWVDHCELYNDFQGVDKDFYDGLLDVKRDADYITFSWNYMHDSWKTSLSGSSDGDDYPRRVTYHHNWYENNNSRLPLFRFGEGHIFNNYYNGIESTGINSRMGACIRVENNYFENAQNPIVSCYSDETGGTDESGNIYGSNITWDLGSDCDNPYSCSWNQAYSYSSVLNSGSDVPNIVTQNAGVGVIPELNSASVYAENNKENEDILFVQNYPNPFNGTTTFSLNMAERSHVTITVYNSMGQQVAVVADKVFLPGVQEINFNASNLASGVYFYHVESENGSAKKSMIIR